MKLKTIKELYDKVKSGEIDESKLEIILDTSNDVFFMYQNEEIIIQEEKEGDLDIKSLYKLIFPKAFVSWC